MHTKRIVLSAILLTLFFINVTTTAINGQTIEETAKIAENLLKWKPGKLIPAESLRGIIIRKSKKKEEQIPFALLIYSNHKGKIFKKKFNQEVFNRWQDFLSKQGGKWPEKGAIIIITDKEELPANIPSDVPAFTRGFGKNNGAEKMTITVISEKRIQAQTNQPPHFSNQALLEAIVAAEICNTMMITLQGEERDQFCVSLGLAVGSVEMEFDYLKYTGEISKILILSGIRPAIINNEDYSKFYLLFKEGPIIELQSLK